MKREKEASFWYDVIKIDKNENVASHWREPVEVDGEKYQRLALKYTECDSQACLGMQKQKVGTTNSDWPLLIESGAHFAQQLSHSTQN